MTAGLRTTVLVLVGLLTVAAVLSACSRGDDDDADQSDDIQMDLAVAPDPPQTGPATIEIFLTDGDGEPIDGAELEIEGNMSHAGMVPVVVDARSEEGGRYVSDSFEFTMGGDWVIAVRGILPDGREIERIFDLEGVSS